MDITADFGCKAVRKCSARVPRVTILQLLDKT
jgi:hypothetical protein